MRGRSALFGLVLIALVGVVYLGWLRFGRSDDEGRSASGPERSGSVNEAQSEPQRIETFREPAPRLFVRLVSSGGKTLRGGQLRAVDADGAALEVDSSGPNEFSMAWAEKVTLEAFDWEGHYAHRREWRPDREGSTVSIELDPHISMRVRFSGVNESLAETLHLSAIGTTALPPIGHLVTADKGITQYQATGALTGFITFPHRPPLHVAACSSGWALATKWVEGTEERLEFRLDKEALASAWASIRICVVLAPDNVPLDDGVLGGVHLSRSRAAVRGVAHFPDENDCVWIQWVPPGHAVVHVDYMGYARQIIELDVLPGEEIDLGTVAIEPAAQIIGSVYTPEGEVVEASVLVIDPSTGDTLVRSPYIADYFGDHFAFDGLSPGEIQLSVIARGWAVNPMPFDVRPGRQMGARVEAAPGGLLRMQSAHAFVKAVRIRQGNRIVWAGEQGGFGLEQIYLAPGTYDVQHRPRYGMQDEWRTVSVDIDLGTPAQVMLD